MIKNVANCSNIQFYTFANQNYSWKEKVTLLNQCPHCRSQETAKYGSVRGVLRRKCRRRLKSYTKNTPKGAPPQVKRMAVHMYLEGNGCSAIGRILGFSKVAILYWVREAGKCLIASKPHGDDITKIPTRYGV